jgi:hypothetical protein
MVSTSTPHVRDTIESIDMTVIPPALAASIKSGEMEGPRTTPEDLSTHVQHRSTFKTFSIMTALFVGDFLTC